MSESNIKRASLADLRRMNDRGEFDHNREPKPGEDLGPDFWADAELVMPKEPKSVHLKVDAEVFDYFKGQGKGHLTRMQNVLKAYVRAHRGS